jgi:hypothetical protein
MLSRVAKPASPSEANPHWSINMKRSLILAAFAGLLATAPASAGSVLSILTEDELTLCRMLEQARETSCFEIAHLKLSGHFSMPTYHEDPSPVATGSVAPGGTRAPFEPQTIPVRR